MFINSLKGKILSGTLATLLLAGTLYGCSGSGVIGKSTAQTSSASPISVDFDSQDLDSSWNSQASQITLNGDAICLNGQGAVVNGSTVTINAAGLYVVTGSLNEGQIVIDTDDKEIVHLVLNGAQVSSSASSPLYIKNADKTVITLAEGSSNSLNFNCSSDPGDTSSDEPDAALFSQDDLTINGGGSLTVMAPNSVGLSSKDDLKLVNGSINVTSGLDGIQGKDSIAVRDGKITVKAGKDGLQSNNDQDQNKGFIYIEGGTLLVAALADGIQAETSVLIKGGNINISSGGGSANGINQCNQAMPGMNQVSVKTGDTESAKGIKAAADITIENGRIVLNTADDAVHSNGSISINGGTVSISSGDDGIHSDASLVVNAGDITIDKSYEGLESAAITINEGSIRVQASDDGLNTSGGSDGSSVNGRPGQNNFDTSDGSKLDINGGYIYVNAQGDGLDSNGDFTMTGGTVIVNGPTNDGNGALDYNGTGTINGGLLIAAGSSGMAQAPGADSAQASLQLNLGAQKAGTLICIKNEAGEEILTFSPAKDYASLIVSSPQLEQGATYTVYVGGSSTGTIKDGLYSGGTYTPGTQAASIQLSGVVTQYGQAGGRMPGSGMGRGPGR
ncbi:MAG: carbohydrate-binding domain-containing protein [Syntrophomonadaceae bacterium]